MALKVKTADGMKTIDTTLHKPVIFLGGEKKVLDKAWTFIGGQKKMLWGATGVQVDLITAVSTASNAWTVQGIGENWLWGNTTSSTVINFDITNLSSPTVKSTVDWGAGWFYNGYQTTSGQSVYYGHNGTLACKLLLDPSTGVLTIGESYASQFDASVMAKLDGRWFQRENLSVSYPKPNASGVLSYQYGTNWIFNSVVKYTTGRKPTSVSDASNEYKLQYAGGGVQINDTDVLVNLAGMYGTGEGLYVANYNGITRVKDLIADPAFLDGDKIVGLVSTVTARNSYDHSIHLYDVGGFGEIASYTPETGYQLKFLGRNGGYYYAIKFPYPTAKTDGVSLLLLSPDDLSIVYEQELPADPFGEYNGYSNYYLGGSKTGGVSQSGFVAIKGNTTSNYTVGRIMRFSQLM